MTELIIALDGPNPLDVWSRFKTDVTWFKIGPLALTFKEWPWLIDAANYSKIFLDLKLADTEATCRDAAQRFAHSGIAALSTFTEAATEAAVRGAEGTPMRVWRVWKLSDDRSIPRGIGRFDPRGAHGVIAPGHSIIGREVLWPGADYVVPGVRMHRSEGDGGHMWITTPAECVRYGATHAVVGRPIWAHNQRAAVEAYKAALDHD